MYSKHLYEMGEFVFTAAIPRCLPEKAKETTYSPRDTTLRIGSPPVSAATSIKATTTHPMEKVRGLTSRMMKFVRSLSVRLKMK